jgi:hypothetical protein
MVVGADLFRTGLIWPLCFTIEPTERRHGDYSGLYVLTTDKRMNTDKGLNLIRYVTLRDIYCIKPMQMTGDFNELIYCVESSFPT